VIDVTQYDDVDETPYPLTCDIRYFNETGPIYMTEHVQAKEFVNFVRDHVVVADGNNLDSRSGKETARFDWQTFRAAVMTFRASQLSTEHDMTTIIPSNPNSVDAVGILSTPAQGRHVPETTVKAILDALVSRFALTFTNAFVPPACGAADTDRCSQTYFIDTLRKNLYHAFTHHIEASDAPERCLSFHACACLDANAHPRSAWEYRLLFVHSAGRSKTVRALVMTVTLEGCFEDKRSRGKKEEGEEAWYGVSLDSRGPFSGTLSAMQLIVGEGFRCP